MLRAQGDDDADDNLSGWICFVNLSSASFEDKSENDENVMCPDHNVGDLHEDDPVAQEVYNEDNESSDFNKPFGITNDALLDIADFS